MPTAASFSLSDQEFWRSGDIHAAFAELRRSDPVSWQPEKHPDMRPTSRGSWAVVRHEDISYVSRNADLFGNRHGVLVDYTSGPLGGILVMDDPAHRSYRGLVNPQFSRRSVARHSELVRRTAEGIMDRCAQKGTFDFVTDVSHVFPTTVILDLMGIPDDQMQQMVTLTQAVFSSDPEESSASEDQIAEIGRELIASLPEGAESLTAHLANGRVNGEPLSAVDAGYYFSLLVTAGIETTGTVLSHAIKALHDFPDQQASWRRNFEELKPTALDEIIRWATPIRHFARTALVDTEIAGRPVKAGDKVALWFVSANRDETVFDEPFALRLDRPMNQHFAFGGPGPHHCLGLNLAKLELGIFFEVFFERVQAYEIGDAKYLASEIVNGVESMPVTLSA
ncbi:cytochrome P450 [Streptomyces sp. NPDC001663]|uniref:cytochrome P450 n=1 Tax=Streptomyces sp. NPDC001663 TaxID=3364597 RepID=UPI003680EA19